MYDVINAIGWRHMSAGDIFVISGMAFGVFLIMAWLADLLLAKLSFGILANTGLLMAGAMLGFALMVWAGYPPTRRFYLIPIFVCGTTAFSLLIVFASLRRAV